MKNEEVENMEFKWFNPKVGAPIVSIASYGLTFSGGALEVLGEPEYVVMGIDTQNKVIGIKPCDRDDKKKIPFISKKRDNYVRVSNKDFIRYLESKVESFKAEGKAKRFLAKWDNDDGILKIFLDQPLN